MARAKRKGLKKLMFESVGEEVPHIIELLRGEIADTDISERDWQNIRPNSVLASIEATTRRLLLASGLEESATLNYSNVGDLYHVLDNPFLTALQIKLTELLIACLSVQGPDDLDDARLTRMESLLYAVGALELPGLTGVLRASEKAAKNRTAKVQSFTKTVQVLEERFIAEGTARHKINKKIAQELGADVSVSKVRRHRKK